MPFGTAVGLSLGHIVSDRNPASPQKGAQQPPPRFCGLCTDACKSANCGLCLLWSNGWMDQDTTWYGGRPWPRRHCVRWDPAPPRKGAQQPPTFLAHFALARSPILATAELLLTYLISYY